MNIRYIFKQYRLQKVAHLIPTLWMFGLCLGISLALVSSDHSPDILRQAMMQNSMPMMSMLLSIVQIVAIVISTKQECLWVTCPLILLNGVFRGFCGMLTFTSFKNGAWLLMSLFSFSAGTDSVIMWYLLARTRRTTQKTFKQDLQITAVVYLVTFLINQLFISPFLTDLLKYI